MSCDEVLRLLREREAACRGEAERLRAEAERITALLATCEGELARITTACQVVGELPRVEPVPVCPWPLPWSRLRAVRRMLRLGSHCLRCWRAMPVRCAVGRWRRISVWR
jgi:hypothetical protein